MMNTFAMLVLAPVTGFFMITDNVLGVSFCLVYSVGMITGSFLTYMEKRRTV